MKIGPFSKLEACQLSCIYQDNIIFTDVSFQLKNGQALLIQGENGSGKSSLLRILSGLATPFSGEVRWQNKVIQQIRSTYAEEVHYISHSNGLKLGLTVAENLTLMQHLAQKSFKQNLLSVLQCLRLNEHEKKQARFLSAGQKRRLALAKLFLIPKTCWIMDEPLTSLDKETEALFLSHLKNHLQEGGMAIISSHHSLSLPPHLLQTLRLSNACRL